MSRSSGTSDTGCPFERWLRPTGRTRWSANKGRSISRRESVWGSPVGGEDACAAGGWDERRNDEHQGQHSHTDTLCDRYWCFVRRSTASRSGWLSTARVLTNDPRADLRRCLRSGSIGGQCFSWESRRVEATVTARDV